MGACLREVEILAFLKVKREDAGIPCGNARFAELASWFYRQSSIGGVDHVCLVFHGGGVSLREAMQERTFTVSASGDVLKRPASMWRPNEVMAIARGLLEVGVGVGGTGFEVQVIYFPFFVEIALYGFCIAFGGLPLLVWGAIRVWRGRGKKKGRERGGRGYRVNTLSIEMPINLRGICFC